MKTNYGLIGKKLGHSFSVLIHNLLGNKDYSLHEITPADLKTFILEKKYKGINVTIPYKTDVIPYLDNISQRALKIGSINTVINKNGILYGDNTDYYGFSYMAKRAGISFKNKKVLILGTGGTSLTARAVVSDEGAKEIIVVGRSSENNYDNLYLHYDSNIIINTTPVGMFPKVNETLIDLDHFKNLVGVIDVIYNPIRTNMLIQAKQKGIVYTNGLSMLVAQAKLAHELFFDTLIPESKIDMITDSLEFQKKNIIFIGMPGCGKTTLGKLIAEKTSRDLIDTDDMIISSENMSIPDIFKEKGEAYFRNTEKTALKDATSLSGCVIATGGGAVLKSENRQTMLRNSTVIWLRRPIEKLAISERPLSKDLNALKEMEKIRFPLYSATADITIDIDYDNINDAVAEISEKLKI